VKEVIGIGAFLIVVLGPVAYLTYAFFAPHLLLNDTSRYLYQYRSMVSRDDSVSLIPGLFAIGEPKDQVSAQLLGSGLDQWNTAFEAIPPGATSVLKFRLRAGAINWACGSELFVQVGFDENNELSSATVAQGGACL
jgi:hypothetical protein